MNQAIELFGFLILATLGLTVPVAAILLSVYQKGISNLAAQYEIKKAQAKKNIGEQIKQKTEDSTTGSAEIGSSLNELKAIERGAGAKLSYMNPKKLVAKLFISLIIALCGVFGAVLFAEVIYKIALLISAVAFVYAIYVMWRTMGVILEAKASIDSGGQSNIEQVTSLLSGILAKVGQTKEQYFLEDVSIQLDGNTIEDNSFTETMKVNEKKGFKVAFRNKEDRMAKRVEVGFTFSPEFIIEDSSGYSIFRDEEEQVIRFKVEEVQGKTRYFFSERMTITPVKQGAWELDTFIKAENIESKYIPITFNVV